MAYERIDSCETQNAALTVSLEKSKADNLLAIQNMRRLSMKLISDRNN